MAQVIRLECTQFVLTSSTSTTAPPSQGARVHRVRCQAGLSSSLPTRNPSNKPSTSFGKSQPQPPPSVAARPFDFDFSYFSDDETTSVVADISQTASWFDSNYLSLSVTCYKIIQKQTTDALSQHFERQHKQQPERQQEPEQQEAMREEALVHSPRTHTCCAETRDHTLICGDDEHVAAAVAPASVRSGGIFLATP